MKVLNIVGSLKIGGQENVAMNILRYAPKNILIDYLVFDNEESLYTEETKSYDTNIIRLSLENKYLFFKRYFRLLKKNNYDVVHIHTYYSSGYLSYISKLAGIKNVVVHSHTKGPSGTKSLLRKFYEKEMKQLIDKYADNRIAVSSESGESLFNSNFEVINNGIDINKYKFNEENRESVRNLIGRDYLLIGHVGRLSEEKNQAFIIDLLPDILKYQSNIHVVLIGAGDAYEFYLRLKVTQDQLDEYVTFVGETNEVEKYLSAIDLLIFPSIFEGMPLTLIEAQINGLPILASDNIDQNINLDNNIIFKSLNESKSDWAETALKMKRKKVNYSNFSEYDVKKSMDKIYRIYGEGGE